MKISILSNLFPPKVIGGAEMSAHALALELARQGHEVSIMTIGDKEALATENGLRIHRMRAAPLYSPYVSKKKPGWIKPAWHIADLYNPIMANKLRRALAMEMPEVLNCHNIAGFSCAAWEAARSLGIPIVQTFHDYHLACLKATFMDDKAQACPDLHFPCNWRSRYHFMMLDRNVRQVISPSRFCVDKLFSHSHRDLDALQVEIIPNGTQYAEGPPVATDWDIRVFKVLFLGTLFQHKGVPVLLEAIELLNQGGNAFEFHLCGTGPLEGAVRDAAARHKNLSYHGFVTGEEKASLLRNAHLLVFPSVWLENSPVTIIEAQALGLPVLGSDIGGIPELIGPVSRELLVTPGSAQALARKISALQSNRKMLRGLSEKLLADRNRYGIRAQAERTLEVYRRAMASATEPAISP